MFRVLATIVAAVVISTAKAGYDPNFAREMVYLSGAAYCSKSTVEAWNCGQACSSVQVSSPTYVYDAGLNVAGYVGQLMTGEILVSFRGTQPSSLKDWIDDLKFVKTEPYPYCTKCEVRVRSVSNALQPKSLGPPLSIGFTVSP